MLKKYINLIRRKLILKIRCYEKITYEINNWTGVVTCKEWMEKGYLKELCNCIRLEEEEEEEITSSEICGCKEVTIGMREKRINKMEWIDMEEWRREVKF